MTRRILAAATATTVAAALLFSTAGSEASGRPDWVGTWTAALTAPSLTNSGGSLTGFTDQSVRMVVRTSVGGNHLRIRLSNAFGAGPVTVGHATVGLPSAPASPTLVPDSIKGLTFQGSPSVTIYKGADVLSDPLAMDVPALSQLAVTLYLPTATGQTTFHQFARERTYVYAGDRSDNPDGTGQTVTRSAFYFLAGIDVSTRSADGTVVVLGDSISDGAGSTLDGNTRWPDFLATRIVSGPPHHHDLGVLNEALSGNQVTHDGTELGAPGFGTSVLARLDSDAFGQTDVQSVIVQLGVNDVNFSSDAAPRIIDGLKQLAAQLRQHGLTALICTVGPFEGFVGPPGWDATKEAVRVQVNDYIRSQRDFDAVVDLDAVLRDPANPTKLLPAYDSGDHIHPNDAGAAALAAAVPLGRL